jgi:hypothetical protein
MAGTPARPRIVPPFSKGRAEGNRGGPLKSATVTPATIGGAFTKMVAYFPSLVVESQNGGRISQAGYVGSGASVTVDGWYTDNGSATGVSGNWLQLDWSEDQKLDVWSGGFRTFSLGSCEPRLGYENFFTQDPPPVPSAPSPGVSFVAYFDNTFEAGLVGPEQSAVRNSACWVDNSYQPAPGLPPAYEGAVKCYPANQVTFPYPAGPAISAFSSIMAYANVTNPSKGPNSQIIYEAAWDCYGFAHLDRNTGSTATPLISLEVMFWTYNHNQSPGIGPRVETGVDLNGDGKLWDLWMTADTAATGGINDKYSYFIWYLQDAMQEDAGWVDILAGIRYVSQYYVKTSGGAPANPLDVPMYQITRGWEVCSTEYSPLNFRMNDYKILMA